MLYKWVKCKTPEELSNYIFCADECQRCKGGVSSKMGKAFLLITKHCKAWARLKDKGFRFVGRSIKDLTITYSFDNYDKSDVAQMNKDLDLLFGGEE